MEKVATVLVNRILGDYIKSFDSQVKFSFSGELELSNLELKDNIIDFLDHPLTLKRGVIKKVYIKIPWYSLSQSESIIKIQGVHILAKPKRLKDVRLMSYYVILSNKYFSLQSTS